jgi:acetoacetyl-CoA reductase/3-oxoacyl-[acyl-carrier protein] reductase
LKILIAGASGGIGKFLAKELCQDHEVYGSYNSRRPMSNMSYGMTKVDISIESDVSSWIDDVCKAEDDLALIYCIGVNYNCMMHKTESDRWEEVIESNLIGVQRVIRHILPRMRERRFGRIVLLSSVVPQMGVPGTSAYSASKSALWGLSKAVAKENARYGITINTINLGYFDIGMIHDVPPEMLEQITQSIPVGRLGDPVNILKAVEFILGTDYLTGTGIDINGGLF